MQGPQSLNDRGDRQLKKLLKLGRFINEIVFMFTLDTLEVGRNRAVELLRTGRSGDPIPVVARFYAFVQAGPGALPDSYTMGTGSLSRE